VHTCPSDDTLGALVHHVLASAEADRVTAHIDGCANCRAAVIAAVRGMGIAAGTPATVGEAHTLAPGTRVGRYEIKELLGAGGMGHVYRAYDAELDRSIALKVLRPELVGTRVSLVDRLVRESRIMAKLSHPALITVHDVGRDGASVFIAMELVRGATLAAHVAKERPAWDEIVRLYARAGEGLAAAHRAGVVHRDFKPDNVLVDAERDRVIVTDFGIARAASEIDPEPAPAPDSRTSRLTATGAAIGTPAYMAPEQLDGKSVDARADVFAFSVSLWEALCGERPFPGKTVAEIKASLAKTPVPARVMPRRLLRALERGLARDRDARWPTMEPLLRELSRLRARRRRAWLVAASVALVGTGVAGAVALRRPAHADPCAAPLALEIAAWRTDQRPGFEAAIPEPATRTRLLKALDERLAAWKTTHAATCKAGDEPAQRPMVAACLEARRRELAGYVEDVIADHPANALAMSGIVGDPARCLDPATGLLSAKVPEDPALRRQVSQLRYIEFSAEAARDRAMFDDARAKLESILPKTDIWPPLRAEALYVLGTVEMLGGDHKKAIALLREGAALAEKVHADQTAANCWVQLVTMMAFDEGDPTRAVEYSAYAEAASARLGKPVDVETLVAYTKGTALVEADRKAEAEVALRHAVDLAEHGAPDYLPNAIQGLGYLYEDLGRYREAADEYRRALASLPKNTPGSATSEIVFRERLAGILSSLGEPAEAETEARKAVELADKMLGPEAVERPIARIQLATVLSDNGKSEEALVESRIALAGIEHTHGVRSERYGEALELEGEILSEVGHAAEAVKTLARACEILAFTTAPDSSTVAECWLAQSNALAGVDRDAEALALVDQAMPLLVTAYGADHPQVANALTHRGQLHSGLGHTAAALADLERAVKLFEGVQMDTGRVASARWLLGKELWRRDHARAKGLVEAAIAGLATAPGQWADIRSEAEDWLATDGHPRHRPRH
jgi:tetratricopeptide (TPR) repeat protein